MFLWLSTTESQYYGTGRKNILFACKFCGESTKIEAAVNKDMLEY